MYTRSLVRDAVSELRPKSLVRRVGELKRELREDLRHLRSKDYVVPVSGVVSAVSSIYFGRVFGGNVAAHSSSPELVGAGQVAGNLIGGAAVFVPVYAAYLTSLLAESGVFKVLKEKGVRKAYQVAREKDLLSIFGHQTNIMRVVGAIGVASYVLKPLVSGCMIRSGVDQASASTIYDLASTGVKFPLDNSAFIFMTGRRRRKSKQ
jgi:hypothetical protein